METPERIAFVTPTRDRPEAFKLCQQFVRRQTLQPDAWMVIDDGDDSSSEAGKRFAGAFPCGFYIRRPPSEDRHTLIANLRCAISLLPKEITWVFIIEDDEWYAPEYAERLMEEARRTKAQLVGIEDAHYWHVRTRRWHHGGSFEHSSLCRTLIHRELIPVLSWALEEAERNKTCFVDMYLWKRVRKEHPHLARLIAGWNLSIGIKGMPGRAGIGRGHVDDAYRNPDPDGKILRSWIGKDADLYLSFAKETS